MNKGTRNTLKRSHFVNVYFFCPCFILRLLLFSLLLKPIQFYFFFSKPFFSFSFFFRSMSFLIRLISLFSLFLYFSSFLFLVFVNYFLSLLFLSLSLFVSSFILRSFKCAYSYCEFIKHSNSNPYKHKAQPASRIRSFLSKMVLFLFLFVLQNLTN